MYCSRSNDPYAVIAGPLISPSQLVVSDVDKRGREEGGCEQWLKIKGGYPT
jgi:hypothetical protein